MEKRIFVMSKFKLSIVLLFLTASIFGCKTSEIKITPEREAGIRESLQNKGSALLIVGLSGLWDFYPHLSLDLQAKLIPHAQRRLVKVLEKKDLIIYSVKEFKYIPFMAFGIYDEETLDFLISSYLVNSIQEDILMPPLAQEPDIETTVQ
jgi:hypothetical protein